uniref:Uncharacterized protein n=1 Tax=Anguilla anguilla TaxID=7936 RepID=A0A0E9T0D2_ANGAN
MSETKGSWFQQSVHLIHSCLFCRPGVA